MSEPFLAEIRIYPYNFAPRGWAFCEGHLLSIAQNTALFSLLGTTYGGNGVSTFGLPNLQNRAAFSSGQGPGLSPYALGQVGGEAAHTLTIQEMPAHTHGAATASDTNQLSPQGNYWAPDVAGNHTYSTTAAGTMGSPAVGLSGNGQAHENMQPYLALNFCIAIVGVYPSRN